MNVIPLIISVLLLILTACAPTTPGMPINGSDQMETLVVENTVADISTPVQPTLTPTLLVPMMGNPTATSPAGDIPERITFAPGSTIATVTGRNGFKSLFGEEFTKGLQDQAADLLTRGSSFSSRSFGLGDIFTPVLLRQQIRHFDG